MCKHAAITLVINLKKQCFKTNVLLNLYNMIVHIQIDLIATIFCHHSTTMFLFVKDIRISVPRFFDEFKLLYHHHNEFNSFH